MSRGPEIFALGALNAFTSPKGRGITFMSPLQLLKNWPRHASVTQVALWQNWHSSPPPTTFKVGGLQNGSGECDWSGEFGYATFAFDSPHKKKPCGHCEFQQSAYGIQKTAYCTFTKCTARGTLLN